uniref:Uncharacterized protein n=1 Tax=Candidatus Kentrum sp. LFY TaxID=2126342 RepID=A0A450U8D7_9GAMM|nr:MAG: hypothetical protein BECKLFY1418B_GA0070995_100934 [Candidatus Kentron sp. LFY]VFJ91133.1 MAG: hypothetical protein BECKLFY1418A_GA0070994_101445 [Candidatus Kentron sp. LFY]
MRTESLQIWRYAENATGSDDSKLKYLGWGARLPASAMKPPGQTRTLESPRRGAGWIFLDWKAPDEGGDEGRGLPVSALREPRPVHYAD